MRPPAGGDRRLGHVDEEQLRFADRKTCNQVSLFFLTMPISVQDLSFMLIKMNKTGLPSLTASPPESESAMWEDAGLPHFAGLFFGIIFLLVLLTYVAKNFQQKAPKTSTISELDRWLQKSSRWGSFTVSRPKCYFISIQAKIGYILGVVLKSPKVFRFPTVQQLIDYSISLSLADVMRDPWM